MLAYTHVLSYYDIAFHGLYNCTTCYMYMYMYMQLQYCPPIRRNNSKLSVIKHLQGINHVHVYQQI